MDQWMMLPLTILGQGDDIGEWVNILIVVVMAIFWVIGGLVKSMTPKDRRQGVKGGAKQPSPPARTGVRKRETWLQQLARKAEELQAAAVERAREMERQAQGRPPRQTKVPSIRPRQPRERFQIRERPATKPSASVMPELDSLTETPVVSPTQEHEPAPVGPTIDLTTPETLRQAVLYYEILGKPLSMRDPFE